jgi:uncharacterized protein YkwD
VGEVIAWVRGPLRDEATRVVGAWMGSPAHRTVLLRRAYRRIGVARRRGGGASYYTATLATRR